MKKPANFSKAEIDRIVSDSADAAKPIAKAPTMADVRDGFRAIVTEGADGVQETSVPLDPNTDEGRRNIGLYQEMFTPQWRAESERSSEVRGREATTVIRGRHGKAQRVQERHAEQLERTAHTPRASIVVPEMPWKRKRRKAGA